MFPSLSQCMCTVFVHFMVCLCACCRLHWSMFTSVRTQVVCENKCASSLERLLSGWGGGAEQAVKELSSASVPQDRLQLSPRGHEKQSELSFLSWTYLCL